MQYKQTQGTASRRRAAERGGALATSQHSKVTPCDGGGNTAGSVEPTAAEVRRLAKELRRSADSFLSFTASSASDPIRTLLLSLFVPVQTRLRECLSASDPTSSFFSLSSDLPRSSVLGDSIAGGVGRVRICALGIGCFDCNSYEGKSSYVQMAVFLTLRQLCTDAVAAVLSSRQPTSIPSASEQEGAALPAMTDNKSTGSLVSASFYDPMAGPLQRRCCESLGIQFEEQNCHGAYKPTASSELLLLFMPRCPWVLFHNLMVANWPLAATATAAGLFSSEGHEKQPSEMTSSSLAKALRHVLIIGNDFRSCPPSEATASAFSDSIGAPETSSRRRRGRRRGGGGAVSRPSFCIRDERITSSFVYHAVSSRRGGGSATVPRAPKMACNASRVEDVEAGENMADIDAGLYVGRGVSYHDVHDALNNMAVMHLSDALSDDEVVQRFSEVTRTYDSSFSASPPLIYQGPDMVE